MLYQHSEALDLSLPLKWHLMKKDGFRRRHIRCHVPLHFATNQYTVKTIDTYDEYLQVMSLRHLVFQKEFAKKRFCLRSDRDRYDSHADFLVVKDNSNHAIVGCYRLLCSKFTMDFYSASEFDISDLMQQSGVKLELSRACILRSHRNGRVLNMLWRGIALYMQQVDARYFFGCGSVQTMDPSELRSIEAAFEDSGVRSQRFSIPVLKKYRMPTAPDLMVTERPSDYAAIPPLLKSYFKAGARICSAPAIDRKFRCADFLVVLDTADINLQHRERYAASQAAC